MAGKILGKRELAKELLASTKSTKVKTREGMENVIETMADLIVCHFQEGGEKVTIRGFGAFKLRRRKSFEMRNPRTGEDMVVPERLSVTFKPSAEVLTRINLLKEVGV